MPYGAYFLYSKMQESVSFYWNYSSSEDKGFTSDHPFSKYAKFSEKLTFVTHLYAPYMCQSGGKKSQVSENFAYVVSG